MKSVRIFSVVMALALFAVAIFPSMEKPVAELQADQTITVTSPVQAFMDAARGLPLLASMNVTAPLITLNAKSTPVPGYACTLVSQSPKNYTWMVSRKMFDMRWTVKNTGAHMWYSYAVVLKYISGVKMQTYGNEFGLQWDVLKGKSTSMVVDMIAPKGKGTYSTVWGLYASKKPFCTFTLTVVVYR